MYRPEQIIVAATPNEEVRNRLLLSWGIYPLVAAGVPIGTPLLTNMVRDCFLDNNLEITINGGEKLVYEGIG